MMNGSKDPGQGRNQTATIPPLFAALVKVFKRDVALKTAIGGSETRVVVAQGRVVAVVNERTSTSAVLNMLVNSGVVSARDIERAKTEAAVRGISHEDALIDSGRVSKGTIDGAREALCLEVLVELMLRNDVMVEAEPISDDHPMDMCALPIRFLLREAQKRSGLLPEIRKVVPGGYAVFAKTEALSGRRGEQRWTDLHLRASDRRVYFFTDGRRSVADLATLTCRSEFNVARSLKTLVDLGLVRRVQTPQKRDRTGSGFIARWVPIVVSVVLIGVVALGVRWLAWKSPAVPSYADSFSEVVRGASNRRVQAAAHHFLLLHGNPPEALDDLLQDRLVRRDDLLVKGL